MLFRIRHRGGKRSGRATRSRSFTVVLGLAAAIGAAMSLGGARAFSLSREAATARLTYTRVLKGSTPEYLSIRIDSTGEGVYEGRNLNDPADFRPLKLSPATTRRLFDLTHALDDFRNIDLESHRKVADLGLKTLTYEQGGEKHQAQFNYSVRREAVELAELFEKIAAVEQHIVALEYESKYDHLSLPRELLQIQIDLNNKVLADPQLMVPTLDAIARNPRFLHIAQARAQNLLERLQDSN